MALLASSLRCLPQQEKRAARCLCPQVETAAFRQAEGPGIAANLENGGRKAAAFDGGFRQP